MERRPLGKTGLTVGALGFGCGNVGGLMVRGTPADQQRAVARALELGINYFDTAPSYGDGESERNLGRVLKALRPDIVLGTKFRIAPGDRGHVTAALKASLDASLGRLGLERIDLLQLHNHISADGGGLNAGTVLDEVVPALEGLRQQGKIRFFGITALGDTEALHRVMQARVLDTAQVCYNLLNPSAGVRLPRNFPAHDFGQLLDRARETALGVIGIRILAAGALSGTEARHPIAVPAVDPIASGPDYETDVRRATRLDALVREGHASSLVEAALRFAIANDAVSTVLVGYSSLEHLEHAAACVNKGPLGPAALARLSALWQDAAAGR
ncbi:MAG TPA: aldo/keto reductase [Candidatus Methylomirabilis sp.]|nr:aldo/keto reductase [Candidatus Methylomirabilis sp.]